MKPLTAAMLTLAWATQARADGIALSLMPADPCGVFAPAIVEDDTAAQADLFALNCGKIPTVAQMVNNYTPGHKTMFWRQPEPLPSPVPLPAAGWLMLAGLGILTLRGMIALMGLRRMR